MRNRCLIDVMFFDELSFKGVSFKGYSVCSLFVFFFVVSFSSFLHLILTFGRKIVENFLFV